MAGLHNGRRKKWLCISAILISADIPDGVCHTAENYASLEESTQEANLLQPDLQSAATGEKLCLGLRLFPVASKTRRLPDLCSISF